MKQFIAFFVPPHPYPIIPDAKLGLPAFVDVIFDLVTEQSVTVSPISLHPPTIPPICLAVPSITALSTEQYDTVAGDNV